MLRCLTVIIVLLALTYTPTASAQSSTLTTRYIIPLNLALDVPAEWRPGSSLERPNRWYYTDDLGAVVLELEPFNTPNSIEQACLEAAEQAGFPSFDIDFYPPEQGRCVTLPLSGSSTEARAVLRLPEGVVRGGARYDALRLSGSAALLSDIVSSARFYDPDEMTAPQVVAASLDLLQGEYLFSSFVTWDDVRRLALDGLTDEDSLETAYDRLDAALRLVGLQGRDNHSQLFRPGVGALSMPLVGLGARYLRDGTVILVYPGSAAEAGGLRVGDRIEAVNGVRLFTLQARIDAGFPSGIGVPYVVEVWRNGAQTTLIVESGGYTDLLPPVINRLPGGMVYIETFGTYGEGVSTDDYNAYLTDAHDRLAQASSGACGYILDVRRNLGGVAFPVLLPMMPLVGDEMFGTAFRPEGSAIFFGRYEAATATISGGAITGSSRLRPARPAVIDTTRPVAVLTSTATASMGEYSAIMLLGDPERPVRIFGQPTAGLLSFLGFYGLPGGGSMWIARTLLTDRSGTTYINGLTPQQLIAVDWTRYAQPSDPVLNAAQNWLRTQGC